MIKKIITNTDGLSKKSKRCCFTGGVKKSNERCLSFPDRGATPVRRYKRIKFQYQDVTGQAHRKEAKGIEAFIIQHEFDHTNDILI